MEGASGCVADLPVGLDDRVPSRKVLTHILVHIVEHFGEQCLIILAEGQRVPVHDEAVDEILGKVGTADNAQLAEEGQTTAVQSDHDPRPRPGGRPACGIGLSRFQIQLAGFFQDVRLIFLGQVLQDRHVAEEPVAGRVEESAVGPLALPGQGNQLIEGNQEFGIDSGSG